MDLRALRDRAGNWKVDIVNRRSVSCQSADDPVVNMYPLQMAHTGWNHTPNEHRIDCHVAVAGSLEKDCRGKDLKLRMHSLTLHVEGRMRHPGCMMGRPHTEMCYSTPTHQTRTCVRALQAGAHQAADAQSHFRASCAGKTTPA